jgi:predicted amidohydrolase
MKWTVALAQIDPILGDLSRNVEKHLSLAEQARTAGASLVVFPELSLTGYSLKDLNWDLAINPGEDVPLLRPLVEASRGISIIAGGVEEDSAFGIYNSAFLFEDGHARSVHRKVYPPTYGMFEEMRYFSAGKSVRAFDTKRARVGAIICEDLWHLPLPYLLSHDGAQVIITLVASPTRLGGKEEQLQSSVTYAEHLKTYARLLSVYLVFCNRVGFEDGINFWGGSMVVSPDGEIVASAKLLEEDLILAVIDDEEVRRARRFSRHFIDDNLDIVANELRRIRTRPR